MLAIFLHLYAGYINSFLLIQYVYSRFLYMFIPTLEKGPDSGKDEQRVFISPPVDNNTASYVY